MLVQQVAAGLPAPRYAFRLNDTMVIDGARGGNAARFINHSCDPNCEAYVFEDRLYIYAMRDIVASEELTFDYQLGSVMHDGRARRPATEYRCRCGAANCRGTMVGRRRSRGSQGAVRARSHSIRKTRSEP